MCLLHYRLFTILGNMYLLWLGWQFWHGFYVGLLIMTWGIFIGYPSRGLILCPHPIAYYLGHPGNHMSSVWHHPLYKFMIFLSLVEWGWATTMHFRVYLRRIWLQLIQKISGFKRVLYILMSCTMRYSCSNILRYVEPIMDWMEQMSTLAWHLTLLCHLRVLRVYFLKEMSMLGVEQMNMGTNRFQWELWQVQTYLIGLVVGDGVGLDWKPLMVEGGNKILGNGRLGQTTKKWLLGGI